MKLNRKVFKRLRRILVATLAIVFVGYVFGIRALAFPGESMSPAVRANDTLISFVAPWHARAVERFDMVIFDLPRDFAKENAAWHKVPWMKRVVGLPGEHIQIQASGIFINGNRLNLPEAFAGMQVGCADPGMSCLDAKLGPDEYFVIGDNPTSSVDSRSIGPIKRALLRGYVWKVIHRGS